MIPARKSRFLSQWFAAYTRNYLRGSFHAVHLAGDTPNYADCRDAPLLVCINHSGWWDVMLALHLANEVVGGEWYGVMDARQLERYRLFSRMGMIGVDRTSLTGAKAFLDYADGLLRGRERSLWLTPQGEMVSNHARPVRFQSGLAHLVERLGDCYLTHIALHYEFWDEKLPEAFVSLSPAQRIQAETGFDRKTFLCEQERRMEARLDELLCLAQERDASVFRLLLRGRSGISPTYDLFRSLTARLRGERFEAAHGDVVTPSWKLLSKSRRKK